MKYDPTGGKERTPDIVKEKSEVTTGNVCGFRWNNYQAGSGYEKAKAITGNTDGKRNGTEGL